jgi:hypothetical protein
VSRGLFAVMARREADRHVYSKLGDMAWHIADPLVHVAYDCSQICRITSHIRACGPSSGDGVALEPSRITTLSSPPPASQAKILAKLVLATSIWPPPLTATI